MAEPTSENSVIAAEMRDLLEGHALSLGTVDGQVVNVLEMPKGRQLVSIRQYLDEYRQKPERREGVVQADDIASFIALVNRFKDEDTALFANVTYEDDGDGNFKVSCAKLVAIIDYHRQGPPGTGEPRFGRHRIVYSFPISEEWVAWQRSNEEAMRGPLFGRFLEDRILDICDPAAAGDHAKAIAAQIGVTYAGAGRLMSVAKDLVVKAELAVSEVQNLDTGEARFLYHELHVTTNNQGTALTVPAAFLIAIPVFRGDARYQLPVRLRYQRAGTAVTWEYKLYRADVSFEHAIAGALKKVESETGLPLFRGVG